MGRPDPEAAAGSSPAPFILARGITRNFGPLRALDGIDLNVSGGEFLTIFGPNGAGKTTLLRVLASLARPTAGTLSLFGHDSRNAPDLVKRRIGLIAHQGYLYGGLGAMDNLLFFGRLYEVTDLERRAEHLLEEVGLLDRAEDPVRTFSRGMQQRLSIARALIHDPDLVLLDEPYTGLDQHASRTLRGMLETVHGRERGVVMVTHHLEEGLEVSTRIAIMSRGRLAYETSAKSLTRAELERTYLDVVGASLS